MLHELTLSIPTQRSSDLLAADFTVAEHNIDSISAYLGSMPQGACEPHQYACAGYTLQRTGPPVRAGAGSCRWPGACSGVDHGFDRSEEHTSELQSLMRTSSAVFCLHKIQTLNTKT